MKFKKGDYIKSIEECNDTVLLIKNTFPKVNKYEIDGITIDISSLSVDDFYTKATEHEYMENLRIDNIRNKTQCTDRIICPNCFCDNGIFDKSYLESHSNLKLICSECEDNFLVKINVSISYSTEGF